MLCSDAPKALKLRREIAAMDISDDFKKALIDCIDLVRWNHEELNNNCPCWQKARRESIHVLVKP